MFYHRSPDERLLMGRLAYSGSRAVFQYERRFCGLNLEPSPFHLPLGEGLLHAREGVFEGLFGLFDDSLPDGWGRLLLDRLIREGGARPEALTPLDRLSWVGSWAMGALSYEPAQEVKDPAEALDLQALGEQVRVVLEDRTSEALETLLRLGGSPQGARPKVLVLLGADGEKIVAGEDHRPSFTPYLVKFPARDDPRKAAGAIEYAYSLMARSAGVAMAKTRLLAPKRDHPGFFATQRFDRRGPHRVHTHTASGLLNAPPGRTVMGYAELLKLTRLLTRDARDVNEMFHREVFNVYAHNRDDHSRNFAFLMEADGVWKIAPAYDLTFAPGPGGEHTLLVGGAGRDPGEADLMKDASAAGVDEKEARAIIERVREACGRWPDFARQSNVPQEEIARIEKRLTELK